MCRQGKQEDLWNMGEDNPQSYGIICTDILKAAIMVGELSVLMNLLGYLQLVYFADIIYMP